MQNTEKLEDNKNNLKSIGERLKAPSPPFFKKIAKIMIAIGTVGGIIVGTALTPIVLPAAVLTVGGYMVAIGGFSTAVAKMAVDWKRVDEIDRQQKKDGDTGN